MESDFNSLSIEFQEKINNCKVLLNGLVHNDSPEKQTVDFELHGKNRKAVFKLIDAGDGTKQYEFDYLAY